MSFADTLNQQSEHRGGKWINLTTSGEAIIGELIDIEERDKTWKGTVVLGSKSGKPRKEWVITLRVDPVDDDDDGLRKLAAAEGLQWAILDHLRDNGVKFPSTWGGRLAIGVVKGKPDETTQVEEWSIRYSPPSAADAINAAAAAPSPAAAADPLAGLA